MSIAAIDDVDSLVIGWHLCLCFLGVVFGLFSSKEDGNLDVRFSAGFFCWNFSDQVRPSLANGHFFLNTTFGDNTGSGGNQTIQPVWYFGIWLCRTSARLQLIWVEANRLKPGSERNRVRLPVMSTLWTGDFENGESAKHSSIRKKSFVSNPWTTPGESACSTNTYSLLKFLLKLSSSQLLCSSWCEVVLRWAEAFRVDDHWWPKRYGKVASQDTPWPIFNF